MISLQPIAQLSVALAFLETGGTVLISQNNAVLNLQLAQAFQGIQGIQGIQGPAGASAVGALDIFTPTNGQTVFQLSQVPKALSVNASVNGQTIYLGFDFTVAGSVVTLLSGLGYALSSIDKVQFSYSI